MIGAVMTSQARTADLLTVAPPLPIPEEILSRPVLQTADDDARVVSAEAKTIAHRVVKLPLAGLFWGVIQIAGGVGVFEVDRRRNDSLDESLDCNDQLNAAAG